MWLAMGMFIVPLLPVLKFAGFSLRIYRAGQIFVSAFDRFRFIGRLSARKIMVIGEKDLSASGDGNRLDSLSGVCGGNIICITASGIRQSIYGRQAIETKPESWGTHYNLAVAEIENKNYQPALDELDKSLLYDPAMRKDDQIYNNRGLALQKLGKADEAKRDYIKAIEINPKSLDAIVNLGALYFTEGNYVAAETELKKAVELKPNNAAANYNYAKSAAQIGHHREALVSYEKLLPVEKQDADLMYNAAISYAATGQKETARTLLDNAYRFAIDENLKKQIADEMQKLK